MPGRAILGYIAQQWYPEGRERPEMDETAECRGTQMTIRDYLSACWRLRCCARSTGLIWSYTLAGRLTHAERRWLRTQQQNQKLASALDPDHEWRDLTGDHRRRLGQSPGEWTQKQLEEERRQDLLKPAAERMRSRLAQAQSQIRLGLTNGVSGR